MPQTLPDAPTEWGGYRMLRPERATFIIVRRSAREWYLSQIRGPGNRQVDVSTRRLVERWLRGYVALS